MQQAKSNRIFMVFIQGPLAGALLVVQRLAAVWFAWNVPTIGVHHMEGRLLPCWNRSRRNFLLLLFSGGHTQLVKVTHLAITKFRRIS